MGLTPLHASAVAFGAERGVLILGPSGAGKSQLALALIDAGAELVADDRVQPIIDGGALFVRAPRTIAGLIEARGLGVLRLTHRRLVRIVLTVDLADRTERLPEPRTRAIAGVTLPCLPARPDEGFARALAHYLQGRRARV